MITKRDNTDTINADAYTFGFNNYTANDGLTYYEVKAIHKTLKELKNENDSLYKHLSSTNVRIRRIEKAVSIGMNTKDTFIVTPYIDTVFVNGKLISVEYDTYTNGILDLSRTRKLSDSTATYSYKYAPTLYLYLSKIKVGNWKLKNLLIRRPVNTKATIKSNDINMVIDSVEYINIK